jgi:hypothetical protein
LRYKYQAGQPEDCAISHNNLAEYLQRQDADAATVLAHRLAAATLRIQIQSGLLPTTVSNLANSQLPPAPPSFAEVVAEVESIEGVRFAALFERLPHTTPDGDAAIAAVWQLVAEEKGRREGATSQRAAVLDAMPAPIRAAIECGDTTALAAALDELPSDQSEAIVQQLQDAGIIGTSSRPDMQQVLENFSPLLQGIAAVARGEQDLRDQIEAALPQLEQNGWQLTDAVHRIWAGQRDPDSLTANVDSNSAQLIRHILDLLTNR